MPVQCHLNEHLSLKQIIRMFALQHSVIGDNVLYQLACRDESNTFSEFSILSMVEDAVAAS